MMPKKPFDINLAMELVAKAVQPYPSAALFALFEEGFTTPFEILMACMISVRTLDEITLKVSRRLFARARTPQELAALTSDDLVGLLRGSTFADTKARNMQTIATRLIADHHGELPCDPEVMLSLPGVGPKCMALALGISCGVPIISVDIHVHRVTNRWGYVQTTTPERTLAALEKVLPQQYWISINRLLVPFGKHICTGNAPACSRCPLLEMCPQIGVTASR